MAGPSLGHSTPSRSVARHRRTPPNADCPHGSVAHSVGITVSAENVAVRNVTVLGFGTCYKSHQDEDGNEGKRLVLDHMNGDCNLGISILDLPSATQFSGFDI